MAGVQGFEPQNGGIKTRCLTAWLYPCRTVVAKIVQFDDYTATSIKWQGYRDSNPRMAGSKPAALPLGYTPAETAEFLLAMVRKERLELSRLAALEPKSSASTNSAIPACTGKVKVVATAGIEPATPAL